MKLKVGDTVLVTAGKDKGKTGLITRVLRSAEKVVVEGANTYTRHIKPQAGRAGDRVRLERPLATAKVAIVNELGQPDRIGYKVAKDGGKTRIFKKTGAVVPEPKQTEKK